MILSCVGSNLNSYNVPIFDSSDSDWRLRCCCFAMGERLFEVAYGEFWLVITERHQLRNGRSCGYITWRNPHRSRFQQVVTNQNYEAVVNGKRLQCAHRSMVESFLVTVVTTRTSTLALYYSLFGRRWIRAGVGKTGRKRRTTGESQLLYEKTKRWRNKRRTRFSFGFVPRDCCDGCQIDAANKR